VSASPIADKSAASPGGRGLIALSLLWLCGLCLRLSILTIPPVIPLLHADLHMSETGIGVLSSLPPMLLAIGAVPGALLIARYGILPALLVGLVLNAIGSVARAAIPDALALDAFTIVMAAGVAIMQPALPPLVRAWFPQRIGFATAVYSNGLLVSEIVVVALTIPFVLPLVGGSWRLSFVVWSVLVMATAALFAVFAPRVGGAKSAIPTERQKWWPDWKRPLIWRLGLILASVNTTYFVTNAFLPDYVIAVNRPDLVSSSLTALNVAQLPASFLMMVYAGRLVTRPWVYVLMGSLCLLSLIGMMVMQNGWIVFWAALLGFANSVTMVLAFALPSVFSAPDDVHRTSAAMFTISYSCAMAVAVFGGWLWDVTDLAIAGLVPVACCEVFIIALASTVKRAERQPATSAPG